MGVNRRAPILTVASGNIPRRRTFIRLLSMGSKIAKLQISDRSPQEDCVFCGIVKGVGSRKIHDDGQLVAFHDNHPAAKIHILVIPKQHIPSTKHLRNCQEDKDLLLAMLDLGRYLVAKDDEGTDIEPSKTKFGFHTPPFLTVQHLHLHCFALPHKPSWMGYQFLQTPGGQLGFITVEQALQQLEEQEPYQSEGTKLKNPTNIPNGKI